MARVFQTVVRRVTRIVSGGFNLIAPERRRAQIGYALSILLGDRASRRGLYSASINLLDRARRATIITATSLALAPIFRGSRRDNAQFTFILRAVARSTSPDADTWGDAWTEATLGQTGVNHGNETPLQVGNLTALTERRGFMKIDLRGFSALAAAGGSHALVLNIGGNTSGLTAVVMTIAFGGQAASPFTESTLTQSNQPATPTGFTKAVTLPAGAPVQDYSIALSDAEMQQLLGRWALLVMTVPLLTTVTISPRSREAAEKPTLTFTARRA